MKRSVVYFLILTANLSLLSATIGHSAAAAVSGILLPVDGHYRANAAAPAVRLASASADQSGSIVIYGCDGTSWEGSTGVAKGQEELQGTWVGHEIKNEGEWTLTFTGSGTFEARGPSDEWYSGKYACDSNQDPKQLNLYIKQSGDSARVGQTTLVIYRVEPDKLTFALSSPGVKSRPGSFAPENGGRILVVTKKQE